MNKMYFLGCMGILAAAAMLSSCSSDNDDPTPSPNPGSEVVYKWTTNGGLKACDHILFGTDDKENANGTQIGNGDQEFVFTGKQTLKKGTYLLKLFNAGAVGYLAMRNATVAGAVGGCQAEVGVASAMAASAAVELMGGTPKQCLDAASTVLMNMLGLVCDPVGGLVEYPCQNRNAAGVANALIAAEMSLAGISQLIPFDEMLEAMYKVGKRLPVELRETALSGCATTPSACEACHIHA